MEKRMSNEEQVKVLEEMKRKDQVKRVNKKKQEVLSECVFKITEKVSEDKGVNLDTLYAEEWGEYFATYLNGFKRGKFEKKLTPAAATQKLNESYIKDVQGEYIPLLQKKRNTASAVGMFESVCAGVRVQIKNKYGVEDYYSLKDSDNKEAKEEFLKFEEFAKSGEDKLTKIQIQNHYNSLKNGSVNAMMDESIVLSAAVCGGILAGLGGFIPSYAIAEEVEYRTRSCYDGFILGFLAPMAVFVSAGVYYMGCVWGPQNEERARNAAIDNFFKQYGFKNRNEAYDYLNDYLQTMPNAEKQILIESVLDNQRLTIAHKYGFDSVEDALSAAGSGTEKEITLQEAFDKQITVYDAAKDVVAQRYGQKDYETAVTYLNNHKILEGETEWGYKSGAGWSVYAYDDKNAEMLANELSNLDIMQAESVRTIREQNWPQTSTDYGTYNDMMCEMQSTEVMRHLCYDRMLSEENYAYGVDHYANHVYYGFTEQYGVDKANDMAGIPVRQSGVLNDCAESAQVASSSDALLGAGEAIAAGGVLIGATTKFLPGFFSYITGKKAEKVARELDVQHKQEKEDQIMMGR